MDDSLSACVSYHHHDLCNAVQQGELDCNISEPAAVT